MSGTTRDNEWQRMTTRDNEWQLVASNDKWQQIVILANFFFFFFFFFGIRDEPTTMHHKDNFLTLKKTL